MKEEVENYVGKCTKCQLNKVLRAKRENAYGNNNNSRPSFREMFLGYSGAVDKERIAI
jgi:hypothetical protein